MSYPEIDDLIYEELENQLGRATFKDYERVVEELPEFVTRSDIKRIVEKLASCKWIAENSDCMLDGLPCEKCKNYTPKG